VLLCHDYSEFFEINPLTAIRAYIANVLLYLLQGSFVALVFDHICQVFRLRQPVFLLKQGECGAEMRDVFLCQ